MWWCRVRGRGRGRETVAFMWHGQLLDRCFYRYSLLASMLGGNGWLFRGDTVLVVISCGGRSPSIFSPASAVRYSEKRSFCQLTSWFNAVGLMFLLIPKSILSFWKEQNFNSEWKMHRKHRQQRHRSMQRNTSVNGLSLTDSCHRRHRRHRSNTPCVKKARRLIRRCLPFLRRIESKADRWKTQRSWSLTDKATDKWRSSECQRHSAMSTAIATSST